MYYGLSIIDTTGILIIALLILSFSFNGIVIFRWYFIKLPKFKKESKILMHSIDGNLASLKVIRYINNEQLKKIYVSRDMYIAFFRIISAFKIQPYYFYYADQTPLIDDCAVFNGIGYRVRGCKFVVDPYRRNFSYGKCLNKEYITSIDDLYS